jgi:hypothetical protein
MAEKSAKKKTKKPAKAETSVLGSLPATRPTRLGRERAATATGASTRSQATTTAQATKTRAATKPRAAKPATPPPRPAPPPPERDGRRSGPPSGPELVTTAVQAAGELAQIGLTLTARALRSAANKLPRP